MKITLDIDPNKISDSINDIMTSLDSDQKKELAKQVLVEWLQEPIGIESQIIFKEAYDRTKNSLQQRDYYRTYSDQDVFAHYDFKTNISKTMTSKEIMIANIRCSIMQFYREQVQELIRNDPIVREQLVETTKHIAEDFPKYVKHAMGQWFVQNMSSMQNDVQALMNGKQERENA